MIEDRFIIEPKDYTLSCTVNFAECHEKQNSNPDNSISATLEFYAEPQKVAETSAKSMQKSIQSEYEDSINLPFSPQENSEIDTEHKAAIDIPFSTENSEKPQESAQSKPNISNFANAHIF